MVCERCIDAVRTVFENSGISIGEISLGEVELVTSSTMNGDQIESKLKLLGFSLVKDPKQILINSVKELVAEVYSGKFDFPTHFQFSHFISGKLNASYKSISAQFSTFEGKTLEQFIIESKVNKIKELLVYTEESLSSIAFMLGYSSVAHLSRQFKSLTGLNPSFFKTIKLDKTRHL